MSDIPARRTVGVDPSSAEFSDLAFQARLAELLDPQEFAAYAAETLPSCRERGHAVRSLLAASDVHLLTDHCERCETRLAVFQLAAGLPFIVVSLQFQSRCFRWVIPMWEPGAAEWLADSVRHRRILLAVEATDSSVAAVLCIGGVLDDARGLTQATRVGAAATASRPIGSLLAAGRIGAFARLDPQDEATRPQGDLHVMVAARRPVAHEVMAGWSSLALSLDGCEPPSEPRLH